MAMSSAPDAAAPDPTEPTREAVEARLRLGLPNRWYPILASERAGARPLRLQRFGEKLVVWRDHGGGIHVQEDRCPHRGAPLSLALNCGDRLRCIYHGIEIGTDGRILSVPGEPGCALQGRQAVKTYPAREAKGAIFIWFGDALHPEPAEFTLPIQLQDGPFEAFLCSYEWQATWRSVFENNMDPMHGTFLHAKSYTMYQGAATASFRTRVTETGFVFEKADQRDVNFDRSEWYDAGVMFCRIDIPYPPLGGPGGNLYILFSGTPIDAVTMAGFSWRCRQVTGWQRDLWQFSYRLRLNALSTAVLEQDKRVLEGTEPDAPSREMLYSHDVGLARIRRSLTQEARKQLRALKAAGLA